VTSQLANRTVSHSATAHYRTTAAGRLPRYYQWQYNGANLPGATGEVLSLTNVQPEQAGTYSVKARRRLGKTEGPIPEMTHPREK
jgi:hypothetical protein